MSRLKQSIEQLAHKLRTDPDSLRAAINELPEPYRATYIDYYLTDLSSFEIADKEYTVRQNIFIRLKHGYPLLRSILRHNQLSASDLIDILLDGIVGSSAVRQYYIDVANELKQIYKESKHL